MLLACLRANSDLPGFLWQKAQIDWLRVGENRKFLGEAYDGIEGKFVADRRLMQKMLLWTFT
jgi:hypothetical protein